MFKIINRFTTNHNSLKDFTTVNGSNQYYALKDALYELLNIYDNVSKKPNTVSTLMASDSMSFVCLSTMKTEIGDAYQVSEWLIIHVK